LAGIFVNNLARFVFRFAFGSFFVVYCIFKNLASFVSGLFPVCFFGSSFVFNNFPTSFFKNENSLGSVFCRLEAPLWDFVIYCQ